MILLKRSPHYGSITLEPVLCLVSVKVGGWEKDLFVEVLITGFALGAYSNYFAVPREETSPISNSLILSALGECLVVGFLKDIFLQLEKILETLEETG
jgi:hypothetical protein